MRTNAVVFEAPHSLSLRGLELAPMGDADVVVDISWSGISTGTEKLLWTGKMPSFPGMGYPLVPGYESAGIVSEAGSASGFTAGDHVFVPGANCYGQVRGLFGGSAARVITQGARLVRVSEALGGSAILLALAATARHTMSGPQDRLPELIVGHGTLGRLMARLAIAAGGTPVVWERNPDRMQGADGYLVIDPADDTRRDYGAIYDVSGDNEILDSLVQRMAPGGEIVLAGFYDTLNFSFPPAFMREARIRCAAQWKHEDLVFVRDLTESGVLSLGGLLTHTAPAVEADAAYRTAFADPTCLKMSLDWSACR